MPRLFIITGSNGAGKSSVGPDYLPSEINQSCSVFDGDKLFMIERSKLWEKGIKANKESKKLALEIVQETFDSLVNHALEEKLDFVYEGHFTNEATWDIPKRFKSDGFSINLIFFGLTDTALSEMRVLDRYQEGGHFVNSIEIESNFFGNLEKLNKYFILFDSLQIVDTSEAEHRVLCLIENNLVISAVPAESFPKWFIQGLPDIYSLIGNSKPQPEILF